MNKTSIIFRAALLLIACLFLSQCGYLIQPKLTHSIELMRSGPYKNDPTHTSLIFKVEHLGLSTFVGRFNKVQASLDFDPQNMANSKLSAIIDVSSLDIPNKSLETTLRGSDWFDVAKYPQASFVTRSVVLVDSTHADFTGDLSFHGVTKPIVLSVVFHGAGNDLLTGSYTLGFSAHTRIKRSDYGMDYLVPAISNVVDIEVSSEFQKD